MLQSERDIHILHHILDYCDQIQMTVDRFEDDENTFFSDFVFQNAVALCILQIGELVWNLSEEYRTAHPDIQWKQIRAVRNIVVHNYGSIDTGTLWEIIQSDIPELKTFCMKEIGNADK